MRLSQMVAYGLTLAVEGAVAYVLAPRFGVGPRRAALAAIVGSALTHPLLWSGAYWLYPLFRRLTVPLLELVVVGAESLAYRGLATSSWRTALWLSFLVNLTSYFLGEVLKAL